MVCIVEHSAVVSSDKEEWVIECRVERWPNNRILIECRAERRTDSRIVRECLGL